jgi:hypothetical protein
MSRTRIYLTNRTRYILQPDIYALYLGSVRWEMNHELGWSLDRQLVATIGDPGSEEKITSGDLKFYVGMNSAFRISFTKPKKQNATASYEGPTPDNWEWAYVKIVGTSYNDGDKGTDDYRSVTMVLDNPS